MKKTNILSIGSIILTMLVLMIVAILLCGCSEADKVTHNMSIQADYFGVERRITVYNARTDNVMFQAEGYMSLSNNTDNELVATFKTGPNEYKVNYIYLNEYTLYTVEDISGTHTDPYHYAWVINYNIIPSIEFKP